MYTCKICGKSYDKKQSLAGHVSSHNRGESYKIKRQSTKQKEKSDKHFCKYCGKEYPTGIALGGHTGSCIKNPTSYIKYDKTKDNWKGRSHTEETKKKMSESMKLAHKEGRAWNIGQSRWNNKQSYSEKFFETFLKNENIDYVSEHPVGIYSIDFAILDKKIAIEIDGKTHFTDDIVIERDKRKNSKLKEEGWFLLRIKWTTMFNNTKPTLNKVLEFIKKPEYYKEIY